MRLFAYHYLIEMNNTKRVLVHRRFEIDNGEPTPRTVSALRMMLHRKAAVVFHE